MTLRLFFGFLVLADMSNAQSGNFGTSARNRAAGTYTQTAKVMINCNLQTLENCNEHEQVYAERVKHFNTKQAQLELEYLQRNLRSATPDPGTWVQEGVKDYDHIMNEWSLRRIHIVKQQLAALSGKSQKKEEADKKDEL